MNEESSNTLFSIPKELLIIIFNNTGEHYKDIDGDIEYPVRRDILQLYITCKYFSWLSELWITYNDGYCEYDVWHYTINIFGKHIGPQYAFYPYYENSPSQGLSGYKYVIEDYGCLICSDDHFYTEMKASNYGVLVVNGEDYDMDDESAGIMAIQVFNQFKLADPDFYQWSMENKWKAHKVYVRLPIKNYPIYSIDIPPALIPKNNHIHNYF